MDKKIYLNGLGLVHPSGRLEELLAAFSGNVFNGFSGAFYGAGNCPAATGEAVAAKMRPTLKDLLPGANLRRVPRSARMALEAAALAMLDAGLPARMDDALAARAGIFTGSAHCCVEASFGFMDSIIDFGAKLSSPTAFSLSVNNVFTGMLSLYMNMQGPSYTSCQFGASFAGAFAAAAASLLAGGCDVALVGAVEEDSPHLREIYNLGFSQGAAGPATAAAPLDSDWERPGVECAVFFALGIEKAPHGVEVSLPVWSRAEAADADMVFSALPADGEAPSGGCVVDCRALYGSGPAMQALDAALAFSSLRHGLLPAPVWCAAGAPAKVATISAACECYSPLTGSYSSIFFRKD